MVSGGTGCSTDEVPTEAGFESGLAGNLVVDECYVNIVRHGDPLRNVADAIDDAEVDRPAMLPPSRARNGRRRDLVSCIRMLLKQFVSVPSYSGKC